MNLEQMKSCLYGVYAIAEEKSTANAEQLKLDNGAVINVFGNGNYNVQGKNSAEVKEHIEQCLGINKIIDNYTKKLDENDWKYFAKSDLEEANRKIEELNAQKQQTQDTEILKNIELDIIKISNF